LNEVIICRLGEKVKTVKLNGIQADLLIKTNVLEIMHITIEPGASLGEPYMHVGEEAHLILEGEIEAEITGKKYLLKTGDAICFPSTLPHTAMNPGKERLVYCSVTVPPTFM